MLKSIYCEINGCTIIVNPTEELKKAYFNMSKDLDSLVKLFKKYSLPDQVYQFDDTAISIYVPTFHQGYKTCMMSECFAISIDCIKLKGEDINQEQFGTIVDNIVEKLSIEVLNYIQFNLTPVHLCKILNINEYVQNYGHFNLKDFVEIATGSQKSISDKLEISKNYLSEIVSGKKDIPINLIKKIHKAYPLFPIEVFLNA